MQRAGNLAQLGSPKVLSVPKYDVHTVLQHSLQSTTSSSATAPVVVTLNHRLKSLAGDRFRFEPGIAEPYDDFWHRA